MSNIYLLERGGANAAKYFASARTLLVETSLSEGELGRARITDNHKHITILDERTSHVHFTKLDEERMEVIRKMLNQHTDKDFTLFNGGRWCMEALLKHGSKKDIDRATDRGLDRNTFKEIASKLLAISARSGDHEAVRHLLPYSDDAASNSYALRPAANHGHVECVELLLPHSDATVMDSWALRSAADSGHADCVELLLPHSDARVMDSWALRSAANNGHLECVKLLLPHSDIGKSGAIGVAVANGHIEVANTIKAFADQAALRGAVTHEMEREHPVLARRRM